jgi:energy-coupling factor transport system permease protein
MIAAITYLPRRSPLARGSALAATAFLGSFALVAFAFSSPIVLIADAVAVVAAGLAAGARPALLLAARWSAWLGALMITTNVIASQRGETLLVRGPEVPVLGTIDISAEALAEGALIALRLAIVVAVFMVHAACVDPDRLLRLARPVARRSALTATLVLRLAPLAAADHARLAEAAALRGPAAAPVGRGDVARRLVAGSLDRAIDVAATLELRGFARGVPSRAGSRPRGRSDRLLWIAAAAVLASAVAGLAAGFGSHESYPRIVTDAGAGTLAFAASLPLLALLPFAGRSARDA